MNAVRAEEILKAISNEGSDLNRDYQAWLEDKMSGLVFDLLFYLSTPEKVVESTSIPEGADPCTLLLGVSVGRAKAVDIIQSLDQLKVPEQADIPETFGVEEEDNKGA